MKSFIDFVNGRPYINVDGESLAPVAYTTYFDECGEYQDFAEKGCRMYFVNVSFTTLPINNMTGFSPFLSGVFENEEPDFSELDKNVSRVLEVCPDALIFPRINISMPGRWTEQNLYETVKTVNGGYRESMYSEVFRRDASQLLEILVSHIRSSPYAENIAGYQLCGGTTQEWFHHDLYGSFSEMGLEKFRLWLEEKYGYKDEVKLEKADLEHGKFSEMSRYFALFSCEMTAKTAEYFAMKLKKYINNEQIVGIFYGYNAFVNDYLWGHQGLRHIIRSPYIDFFSSPCAYDNMRVFGIDWGDMIPVDSVKHNKKLSFIECDIRTHLTKSLHSMRPGMYSEDFYTLTDTNGNKTIWAGPETEELSLSAVRKAFTHQLIKASGVWWFDMWGGWYHSEALMNEIEKMKDIAEASVNKNAQEFPSAQTVVFVDEAAFSNLPRGHHLNGAPSGTRINMGKTGIPFDLCMVEDAPSLTNKYRAAIFTAASPSESGKRALELFREKGIYCLEISEEKTHYPTQELRSLLTDAGAHCYIDTNDVIYSGNGFLGIHASSDGEKNIRLPERFSVRQLLGGDMYAENTDSIRLYMKKYETVLFELYK